MSTADDRTLRLAAPEVTVERLDRFIAFQRAWLARAGQGHVAEAHSQAVQISGLSPRDVSELDAVVRDFCGRARLVRELERKLATTSSAHKRQRIQDELPKRRDFSSFERRYGASTLQLLRARESELVDLHDLALKVPLRVNERP